MPSTTTNYGWSYPISSDDLNAGATTIGTLATGIDSTVKAQLATKATFNATSITVWSGNVTTDANGYFTVSGFSPNTEPVIISVKYTPCVIEINPNVNQFRAWYRGAFYSNGYVLAPVPGWTITVNVLKWA